ncbi:MAG: transposase [Ignavibacteria bacterium GWB2_35_12]|nr:MAG: transposase [Ignavibacteria bacterium GWB2_35_12]OGV02780.1 MAG: transposase [Ignavibacteria bacterium RIFOXYA2_FULL_37_17]OGV20725.1 MAG: transposase [Ignavibacteria bacterium RIFOXYC2_FULL_35_21]
MSFVKIMIHAVWGTKNREPYLQKDVRKILFEHIIENAKSKNIYIDTINGHLDHIHCLFSLGSETSISKAMQLIKGESAFWANKEKIIKYKLDWANEYFAVSVSESMIEKVRNYIINQEEHHRKKTFVEEFNEFKKKYKFE